ncbi:MAG: mycothiol synthase, partial [Dermatophilaceae bacterium]
MTDIDGHAEVDAVLRSRIDDIRSAASRADGVEPLSEAFVLALAPGRDMAGTQGGSAVAHLVAHADGGAVVGYGQVTGLGGNAPASAEFVVHPDDRRRGHGRALLDAVVAAGAAAVWAHGNLASAGALASSAGWRMTRSLHLMARTLSQADRVDPELPPGFTVRPFQPGHDDTAWVHLNAAAFAAHPEQGRMTVTDLRERMDQAWFDPAGLLMVEHRGSDAPVAFHWTKIDPTAIPRLCAPASADDATRKRAGRTPRPTVGRA